MRDISPRPMPLAAVLAVRQMLPTERPKPQNRFLCLPVSPQKPTLHLVWSLRKVPQRPGLKQPILVLRLPVLHRILQERWAQLAHRMSIIPHPVHTVPLLSRLDLHPARIPRQDWLRRKVLLLPEMKIPAVPGGHHAPDKYNACPFKYSACSLGLA